MISSDAREPLLDEMLMDAIRTELDELGVRLVQSADSAGTARPTDRDALAFVWIEHTPGATVVHFYESAGRSLRERRIPVVKRGAGSVEEVAIVVRSAVNALLERARATASVPTMLGRPSPPPHVSATATRRPAGSHAANSLIEVSLGYSGTYYAPELTWQHGATVSLVNGRWSRWRFGTAFTWVPPSRAQTDQAQIVLRRYPLELFLGFETPLAGHWLGLRPEGAVGVDVLGRRTERVRPTLEQTPAATRVTWETSTRLRLTVQPTSRWGLYALVGADFVLNRVEQVIGSETLITPFRARPRLELGLAVRLP
ncbi:MAG: hypothetical protein JW940_03840 [Polyangiaceae bacterium]|nr:hypothetical protein [Polyangiaceae bacterium]